MSIVDLTMLLKRSMNQARNFGASQCSFSHFGWYDLAGSSVIIWEFSTYGYTQSATFLQLANTEEWKISTSAFSVEIRRVRKYLTLSSIIYINIYKYIDTLIKLPSRPRESRMPNMILEASMYSQVSLIGSVCYASRGVFILTFSVV